MNRFAPLLLTVLFGLSAQASAACQRQTPVTFAQPAQRLDQALQTFAHQTGCAITVQPDALAGRRAQAVSGTLRPAQALARLLGRQGLYFQASADGYAVTTRQP